MSDISTNSPNDLISDSGHSDVDEPSIAPDQLGDDTRSTDQSSVVEPTIVEAKPVGLVVPSDLQNINRLGVLEPESPTIHTGGTPTSPTNATLSRKNGNPSDIDQISDNSDDDNSDDNNSDDDDSDDSNDSDDDDDDLLSTDSSDIDQSSDYSSDEDFERTDESDVDEQENTDVESGELLTTLSFLLITCFIVVGVYALFCQTVSGRNNVYRIDNETQKHQSKIYRWTKEEKQKMIDDARIGREEIEKIMKISEIRKNIQGKTHLSQLPENLWNKFIPDFSKFEGVYEFLQQTQTNGTHVEEYLYYTTPRFQVHKKIEYLGWIITGTSKYVQDLWIKDCNMDAYCHRHNWFMKNGDLYIHQTIVLEFQEYKFTRVYFIPPYEMI